MCYVIGDSPIVGMRWLFYLHCGCCVKFVLLVMCWGDGEKVILVRMLGW